MGVQIGKHRATFLQYATRRNAIISGLLFVLSWIIFYNVKDLVSNISFENELIAKCANIIYLNFWNFTYSLLGGIFLCILINYIFNNYSFSIPSFLVKLSGYCFGVYIYQQFILQILYYKFNWISLVNPMLLPWVSAFVTLIVSLLLTHLTLKTRFGRFLLG